MEEKAELDPTKVTDACISLCDILNGEALKRLHAEETDEAMTMLKKAELLAANTNALNGLCVCVCVLVWPSGFERISNGVPVGQSVCVQ